MMIEKGGMRMRIGYACLAVAVPGSALKSCALKNADEERLLSLIGNNLAALETMVDYNIKNGIGLYRVSSDLVPFGSSAAADLKWDDVFADDISRIGEKIRHAGMRVSMHPGQYTHLSSPDTGIGARAEADLRYHAKVLDALGAGLDGKIILHLGGAYGDKRAAKARFLARFDGLMDAVKRRLALENDDSVYHIGDVLEVAEKAGLPVVFDALHDGVNPADGGVPAYEWIGRCAATWRAADGPQKIHYSQQNPARRPGAHSETIAVDVFRDFISHLAGMELDVMLEVKDKNRSAVKCLNCLSNRGIAALEAEWARYKYLVLEKSPAAYGEIRQLLKDKRAYPAMEMYRLVEQALGETTTPGNAVNAAGHVWGYFKDRADGAEKRRFQKLSASYAAGDVPLASVKGNLRRLAEKYGEKYLLESYYF
jgi:UV DNA damage endonuclease